MGKACCSCVVCVVCVCVYVCVYLGMLRFFSSAYKGTDVIWHWKPSAKTGNTDNICTVSESLGYLGRGYVQSCTIMYNHVQYKADI